MNNEKTIIRLAPYTIKDLSLLYGVHRNTFRTWLKPFESEIGEKIGRYYTVRQTERIFDKLGYPMNKEV